MEDLHGDLVAVIAHAEGITAAVLRAHGHAGVADVLFKDGGRIVVLEIIPEHAAPHTHGEPREASERARERRPEHLRVNGLHERGGKAEHRHPVPPHGSGVYLCGVVKPHPVLAVFVHSSSSSAAGAAARTARFSFKNSTMRWSASRASRTP